MDRNWIYSECEQLAFNRTQDDFFKHLEKFTSAIEFDRFLYTALPSNYRLNTSSVPYVALTTYDQDWMEYYIDHRYDIDDAALQHCLAGNSDPYIWPGSKARLQMTPKQLKVFREANSANLYHGFTYPMHHLPGAMGIYTATYDGKVSTFNRLLKEKWDAINLFSYAFHDAILRNHTSRFGDVHKPNLTPKEKEVLKWLCNGDSYDDISVRLSIGLTTVKKHVIHILEKTGAKNSTHACVLALRWGYL